MKNTFKLSNDELWSLLNVLNEACNGLNIVDFEHVIGVKKQIVIEFIDKLTKEEDNAEAVLLLNATESEFLKNIFKEVFKQIDEWEFQTRIGVSKQEINKIKDELNETN